MYLLDGQNRNATAGRAALRAGPGGNGTSSLAGDRAATDVVVRDGALREPWTTYNNLAVSQRVEVKAGAPPPRGHAIAVRTLPGGSIIFASTEPQPGAAAVRLGILSDDSNLFLRLEGTWAGPAPAGAPGRLNMVAQTTLDRHPDFVRGEMSRLEIGLPGPHPELWSWNTLQVGEFSKSEGSFMLSSVAFGPAAAGEGADEGAAGAGGEGDDGEPFVVVDAFIEEPPRLNGTAGGGAPGDHLAGRAIYNQGLGLAALWYITTDPPVYYELYYPYRSELDGEATVVRALMGPDGVFKFGTTPAVSSHYSLELVWQVAHTDMTISASGAAGAGGAPAVEGQPLVLSSLRRMRSWEWCRTVVPLALLTAADNVTDIAIADLSGEGSFFLLEQANLVRRDAAEDASVTVECGDSLRELAPPPVWVVSVRDGANPVEFQNNDVINGSKSGISGPFTGSAGPGALDLPDWAIGLMVAVASILLATVICVIGIMWYSPMGRMLRKNKHKGVHRFRRQSLFCVALNETVREVFDDVRERLCMPGDPEGIVEPTVLVSTVKEKDAEAWGWSAKPGGARRDPVAVRDCGDPEGALGGAFPTEYRRSATMPSPSRDSVATPAPTTGRTGATTWRSEEPPAEGAAAGTAPSTERTGASEGAPVPPACEIEASPTPRRANTPETPDLARCTAEELEQHYALSTARGSTARSADRIEARMEHTRRTLLRTVDQLAAARVALESAKSKKPGAAGPGQFRRTQSEMVPLRSSRSRPALDAQVKLLEGVWHKCMAELNHIHNAARGAQALDATPFHGEPSAAPGPEPDAGQVVLTGLRNMEVNFEHDIAIQGIVGTGSSGVVYYGTFKGKPAAIKVLHESDKISSDQLRSFRAEVEVLATLKHENIVQFFGGCSRRPNVSIITELCEGGSLYSMLHEQHKVPEYGTLLKIAKEIAAAMAYCHRKSVIHRDLKSHNVLLTRDGVVKVADFGIAREQQKTFLDTKHIGAGTVAYMAPEIFSNAYVDEKCDVYSFGVIIWECLCGQRPWEDKVSSTCGSTCVARQGRGD